MIKKRFLTLVIAVQMLLNLLFLSQFVYLNQVNEAFSDVLDKQEKLNYEFYKILVPKYNMPQPDPGTEGV